MQEEIHKRLHASKLGPCACSQVRRLGRKLSSLYDTLLSPEDLTITKYSLLADIERAGQLSHAVLAEKVGMNRTTLTRNLRPLTRAKWVAAATGKDPEIRQVSGRPILGLEETLFLLFSPSEESLAAAYRYWERVNSRPDREPAVSEAEPLESGSPGQSLLPNREETSVLPGGVRSRSRLV
jgi:Winged helix-turn-helix DNA-binding